MNIKLLSLLLTQNAEHCLLGFHLLLFANLITVCLLRQLWLVDLNTELLTIDHSIMVNRGSVRDDVIV